MEVYTIYYDDYTNTFKDQDSLDREDVSNMVPGDVLLNYKNMGGTYYYPSEDPNIMYELDFPIPNGDERILYYNKSFNIMVDEEGYEMFNIFSIITPNQYNLFRQNKEDMCCGMVTGGVVSLVYGDEEEDVNGEL